MPKTVRIGALVASGLAGLTIWGVADAGQVTTEPTTIVYDGDQDAGSKRLYFGRVLSDKRRCLPGRTVEVTIDGGSNDTDTTSAAGAWAVFAVAPEASVDVRVLPKRIGKRVRCGGDSTTP